MILLDESLNSSQQLNSTIILDEQTFSPTIFLFVNKLLLNFCNSIATITDEFSQKAHSISRKILKQRRFHQNNRINRSIKMIFFPNDINLLNLLILKAMAFRIAKLIYQTVQGRIAILNFGNQVDSFSSSITTAAEILISFSCLCLAYYAIRRQSTFRASESQKQALHMKFELMASSIIRYVMRGG